MKTAFDGVDVVPGVRLLPAEPRPGLLGALSVAWLDGAVASVVAPDALPQRADWLKRRLPEGRSGLPASAALIVWTSGSTGAPRAVLLGHERLGAVQDAIADYLPIGPGRRVGHCLPLHTSYGLIGQALATQRAGGTWVDVREAHLAGRLLDGLADQEVNVLSAVPSVLGALADALEQRPARLAPGSVLPALDTLASAGAPLPLSLARRLRALLPRVTLWNQYGTTELGPRLAAVSSDDPLFWEGAAGRLLPGCRAWIDDDGEGTGTGTGAGAVTASTPWQMLSALGEGDDAAHVSPPKPLTTGDIGAWLDDDKTVLRVLGRFDDVLLVGGQKVPVQPIVEALLEHPAVRAAAVVGAPHRRLGQVAVAHVVGDSAGEDSLWAHLRACLPPSSRPASIRWRGALPLLPSGKLDRGALRDEP